ncbi:MAG TPA: DNA sulfur modification protein DndB [Chloroflexi bacterium]|nr:DNA sulfur modification protein DndB [Chloroflexota bacterium]
MREKNVTVGYYSFIAIHGRQGKHDYYLTQCPLRLVPRLFLFDELEVPALLRQVRTLKAARVKEIARYLIMQSDSYVLSPLVAAVDCEIIFDPLVNESPEIGQLQIPFTARLVIHDGQHRRAAIQQALIENPALENDTVPVMLVLDPDLKRSPRLYTDLNQTQLKRNLSQRVLHDHDSPLAALVRQLVEEVALFKGLTELEKTTISNRSTALFTLSAVYQATRALLGIRRRDPIDSTQASTAHQFWQELGEIITEWRQVIQGEVTTDQLRREFVHVHSVTLLAIGMVGYELIQTYPDDWANRLPVLDDLDWSRENTSLWEGRAIVRGRMSKARDSILLTVNVLKHTLGLPLTEMEQALEQRFTN